MERHLSVRPTPEIANKGIPLLRFTVLGAADLTGPHNEELRTALVQPKRLALLAYLSLASPRGYRRRDTLVSLFWPDSDEARARHALRQALHVLRRAMGPEAIVSRGDNDLAIDETILWCDARAFEDALDAGDPDAAISLYRGDLLPGFFVANASPDLEEWIAAERTRLKARASTAAWTLAEQAEARGDGVTAAQWARRGMEFSPDDERSLRRVIALLDRLGDRAGALRAHDDFSRLLAAEFEAEPSAETTALVASVRARHQPHGLRTPTAELPAATSPDESDRRRPPAVGIVLPSQGIRQNPPRRFRRIVPIAAGVVAALAIIAAGYAKVRERGSDVPAAPVVAVGNIVERGAMPGDTLGAAGTLSELLATDLARVSGLHVVSHSRLYEILGQLGSKDASSTALADAARRAGATELLEGVLYRRAGSSDAFRLDLRRIELATGVVIRAWSAEDTNLFALADNVTSQFAKALSLAPPDRSLAGVTSNSLVARRFYEQGLRWFYQGNFEAASRYFLGSLEEDSTFGMAAFYASSTVGFPERPRVIRLLARAARNASDAPERERLLIRYAWAQISNEPSALAFAESLAVRYPNEPSGERAWGAALFWSGDFLSSIAHQRRAMSQDSLSFSRAAPTALCSACDAMQGIVSGYLNADSLGAAEIAAREWLRNQPNSPLPRMALAEVLGRGGHRTSALKEASLVARTAPALVRDSWLDVRLAIAAGDFDDAHRLLGIRSQDIDRGVRDDALWWKIIALRYQGRLSAARAAIDRLCIGQGLPLAAGNASLDCALATGPVLFELGRYREAARLYESLPVAQEYRASNSATSMRGLAARHHSWMLTHAATGYAAAGDTVRLKSLTDSVERWGRLSGFGRDQRLHFYLRGLLSAARNRPREAIPLFRRAIYSLSDGYTRINLDLARALIIDGKPTEAIEILSPALRGPIQSNNLYVTHTEIHEMLAQAFERAGRPDSAAAHYRRVALAWKHSDPRFRGRATAALRKSVIR